MWSLVLLMKVALIALCSVAILMACFIVVSHVDALKKGLKPLFKEPVRWLKSDENLMFILGNLLVFIFLSQLEQGHRLCRIGGGSDNTCWTEWKKQIILLIE